MSPQMVHLSAASAVAASMASCTERPVSTRQRKPAAKASPAPTRSTVVTV